MSDEKGLYRPPRFTRPTEIPVCTEQARADLSKLADLVPRTESAADLVQMVVRMLPIVIHAKDALDAAATWIEQHDLDLCVVHPHVEERVEDQPEAIGQCVEMIRDVTSGLTAVLQDNCEMGAWLLALEDLPPAAR